MRRLADDLRRELFQNGKWHTDSFRCIYHQLKQDPRPFIVLHQQGLDDLWEYNKLLYLTFNYIADTRNKHAAELLERLVYDDAQAFWRSFTVSMSRDHSYNERHFQIMSLMWDCIRVTHLAVSGFHRT